MKIKHRLNSVSLSLLWNSCFTFVSAPARAPKNTNARRVVPPATCNVHSIGGTTCTVLSATTANTGILCLPRLRHPDSAWYFYTPTIMRIRFCEEKFLSQIRLEEIINFLCLRLYKSHRCWEFLGSVIDPDRELWKIDSIRFLPGPSPLHVRQETDGRRRTRKFQHSSAIVWNGGWAWNDVEIITERKK